MKILGDFFSARFCQLLYKLFLICGFYIVATHLLYKICHIFCSYRFICDYFSRSL